MDTSIKFLKISRIIFFTVLIGCGHSEEELIYLKNIQEQFPQYSFSLTDPVTSLELTVDIKTDRLDSTKMLQLFKEVKKPIKDYSTVSWVYLIVVNGKEQLTVIRENPGGEIVFIKDRDR